jgi:hypothetical protein
MADTFLVKSALPVAKDGGSVVALWEVDDAHPGGQAFIAGDRPVEVANTAGVESALRDKKIEKVGAESPVEPAASKPGK